MLKTQPIKKKLLKMTVIKIATIIRDNVSSCYGIVRFSPGVTFNGKRGTRSFSLEKGGVCVRLYSDKKVDVILRVIVGYKISTKFLSSNIVDNLNYILKKKDYVLNHLDLYIDGVSVN